ncbi:1931_t:CDS:1, partial [Ambispora leptoticha]
KARKYYSSSDEISIIYWNITFDDSYTNLYPASTYQTQLCTGCILNSNRIQNKYTFNIPANSLTKFLRRLKYTENRTTLNLHANLLDLIYSLVLRNSITILTQPIIKLQDNAIFEIFNNNQSSQSLSQIAKNNLIYSQLTFYTDGSVKDMNHQ